MRPPSLLILPGLGNSGPEHWQSHWERADPDAVRLLQRDWDTPRCAEWLDTLVAFLESSDDTFVIAAHSSACALVAHLVDARRDLAERKIAGALLVAPSDPDGPHYPQGPEGFGPVPMAAMPFRSIVVASDDDPYIAPDKARAYAGHWGAEFVLIARAGHINARSGHGRWPEGHALLQRLRSSA